MPNYKRHASFTRCYFFTVVSYQRNPLFITPDFRQVLRKSVREVIASYPFEIKAWVLLPDHLHTIWDLPDHDTNFSRRWSMIKRLVSQEIGNNKSGITLSRQSRKESIIWQRRFWEHEIRDFQDYDHHLAYCYWNPVKHDLVSTVKQWPYSTFHRDVKRGLFEEDWGGTVNFDGSRVYGE